MEQFIISAKGYQYWSIKLVSNHFHSVKSFLFSSARPRDFHGMLGTGLSVSMYTTKAPIDMWHFNIPQLKEFLTFSVKDRYQLNYFICIKDFNAQTITSWKLNLFSFFIYCCDCTYMNLERKTIRLDIFLLSDRQWGIECQYLLSRFLGVSILQLLIISNETRMKTNRIYSHLLTCFFFKDLFKFKIQYTAIAINNTIFLIFY